VVYKDVEYQVSCCVSSCDVASCGGSKLWFSELWVVNYDVANKNTLHSIVNSHIYVCDD
jgi:hypothetical protein